MSDHERKVCHVSTLLEDYDMLAAVCLPEAKRRLLTGGVAAADAYWNAVGEDYDKTRGDGSLRFVVLGAMVLRDEYDREALDSGDAGVIINAVQAQEGAPYEY